MKREYPRSLANDSAMSVQPCQHSSFVGGEHVRKRPINMMEVSQVPTLYMCPESKLVLQSYQQSEIYPKDRIRAVVRHDEIVFPTVMTSPMLGVRLRNGNPDVVSY